MSHDLEQLVLIANWKACLQERIRDAVDRFERAGLHMGEFENLIGEVWRFKRVCQRHAALIRQGSS